MKIATEWIKLDSYLKLINEVSSGGEAKMLIGSGEVLVNGEVEQRRGRKLTAGDQVDVNGKRYFVERGGRDGCDS